MGRESRPVDLRGDLEALLHESLATADATQFLETAAHIAMAVDAFQSERDGRLAIEIPC